jgi:molybdenum cofactor synthesis domain-containing protein
MCETGNTESSNAIAATTIPVTEAVGTVLAHDITEIRPGDFKGRAFRKGHIVREEDIPHLQRLGKNHLYILKIRDDEMHENDAALAMADALKGEGVRMAGEPKEGKINLVADQDGLLKVDEQALLHFNMLGEIMCATLHNNMPVRKGMTVAGTRAIPLVVKKDIVETAVRIAREAGGIISVRKMRKPRAGVVITGNEVYTGKVKDAFAPVIRKKIDALGGKIVGIAYAPDDASTIEQRIREHLEAGADLIITTGGMSVDPDDVTRFAIRNLGISEMYYGSPVLPGAMFLIAYIDKSGKVGSGEKSGKGIVGGTEYAVGSLKQGEGRREQGAGQEYTDIPVLGIPACGMYAAVTVFDLILPRILAGEKITRREIAALGHGGLCMKCKECRYPVCPFGK